MRNPPVQIGERYGRWIVLERAANGNGRRRHYHCRCDCGTERTVRGESLRNGVSASCGCLREELHVAAITKHGGSASGSSIYKIWLGMRARCSNPHTAYWHIYGGKGIKVDPRWDDFAIFLADMGPRPKGYSIERRDGNGDYTPNNCYWASPREQSRNTSRCRYITWNGETKVITEWAEITGISRSTIYKRLDRGEPIEEALTRPSPRK
jgi:hypothetical protein